MHWARNASLNTIAEDHATRFGVDLAGQTAVELQREDIIRAELNEIGRRFAQPSHDGLQAADVVALRLRRRLGRVRCGMVGCRPWRQSPSGRSVCRRKATVIISSSGVRTVERTSLVPILTSAVVDRLRYFCTVGPTLTGPRQGYVALAARDELNPQLLLELLDLLAQTGLSDVASARGETEMKFLGKSDESFEQACVHDANQPE